MPGETICMDAQLGQMQATKNNQANTTALDKGHVATILEKAPATPLRAYSQKPAILMSSRNRNRRPKQVTTLHCFKAVCHSLGNKGAQPV